MEPPRIRHRRFVGNGNGDGDTPQFILNDDDEDDMNMENYDLILAPYNPRNDITFQIYTSVLIFGIYMLYQIMIFFFLLTNGIIIFQIFTLLSRNGFTSSFGYFGSYYNILHFCLFLKLLQDYFEQKYFEHELNFYFHRIPSFKEVYSCITFIMAAVCYGVLFNQFYYKCKILYTGTGQSNKYRLDPSYYVLSVCYIHYFNVVRCIQGSKQTNVLKQIIRNSLNIKFGMMITKFGGICGTLIFIERIPFIVVVFLLTSLTILMTLIYLGLQEIVFYRIRMGSGTKWAEILWSTLATDFLLKSFFEMNKYEDIQSCGIQFHIGVSFVIFLTTKIIGFDFVRM